MNKTAIEIFLFFIVMILVQVLIFNHVVLFNVAVPIVFIYFIIRMSMAMDTKVLLTLSFLLGLCVDIFSDTPGVNALGCTVLAMVKKPMLYAFVQHDDALKDITPSASRLGIFDYAKYLLSMTAAYCLLAFGIEYFSFTSVKDILVATVSSSLLSFLLMLSFDSLIIKRREKRL